MGRTSRGGDHRWTPTNQELVAWLKAQYPEVRSGKLAVRAIFTAFPEIDDVTFDCVPDGIVIDKEDRRIDLFEAEVTHPIPRKTMWAICDLWMACDMFDITLDLYTVTRYGHINQVLMMPWYLALLSDRLESQPPDTSPESPSWPIPLP